MKGEEEGEMKVGYGNGDGVEKRERRTSERREESERDIMK